MLSRVTLGLSSMSTGWGGEFGSGPGMRARLMSTPRLGMQGVVFKASELS